MAIPVQIDPVAPGLFSADASGKGAAAAVALLADGTTQMTFQCAAGKCTTAPVAAGAQTIILLYGTGIRGYKSISATMGGQKADIVGAAAQGQYPGLDQVNVSGSPRGWPARVTLRWF